MTCAACSAHVEKAVKQVPGVCSVNVNLLGGSMVVEHDGDSQPIIDAVVKAGYGASLPQTNAAAPTAPARPNNEAELKSMKQRLIWSVVFMVPLFYLSMGHMMGWPLPHIFHGTENALIFALTAFLLTLPPLIINQKYFRVGFKALWNRSPNMDSLIAVGASAAVVYGIAALYAIGYGLGHDRMDLVEKYTMELYFESAAMIVTLITVGKFLETRSKGRTGQAIARLLDLSPKTATVLRDGGRSGNSRGAGPAGGFAAGAARQGHARGRRGGGGPIGGRSVGPHRGIHPRGQRPRRYGHLRIGQRFRRSDGPGHPCGPGHDAGPDGPAGGGRRRVQGPHCPIGR